MREGIHKLVVLLPLALIGCGDTTPTDEDEGPASPAEPQGPGDSPNTPSAGAASNLPEDPSGGSETPDDGVLRMALSVEVGEGCGVPAQVYNFPPTDAPPVTADGRMQLFASDDPGPDGRSVDVECSWLGASATVAAKIFLGRNRSGSTTADFGFRADPSSDHLGSILLVGPPFESSHGSAGGVDGCTMTPFEYDEETHSIWGAMDCPQGLEQVGGDNTCSLGPIYFAIENCFDQ